MHVAQSTGSGGTVVHELRTLDKIAMAKDCMSVKYQNGRGRVTEMTLEKDEQGR